MLWLKVEKTLFIIEFALHNIRNGNKTTAVVFNFEQVKSKLRNIAPIEEQLVYLHNIKAEYLQSGLIHTNPSELSFDQKIIIEIKKIHELQEALGQVKSKHSPKNRLAELYMDNEDFLIAMKISKRTAQTWRDEGIIAYSQVRNKIYYLLSDVEALLKSNYMRSMKR